ncbi:MAG: helix-turn-helix transcriptional regulator [Burkholderiaceae bacterium]
MVEEFSELELLLRLTLNQLDYGLVLVDVDSCAITIANGLGRDALDGALDASGNRHYATGLRMEQGRVSACRPSDGAQLRHMLRRTRNGLRGLLTLGGGQRCAIAVVPLSIPGERAPAAPAYPASQTPACHALLVFSKQQLCDSSTMALFARDRGLTNAEGQVLAQVCRGLRPAQIADVHGVQISTVRTQLRNIRIKTCCDTIGEVVQKVSVLPPMARYLSGQMGSAAQ